MSLSVLLRGKLVTSSSRISAAILQCPFKCTVRKYGLKRAQSTQPWLASVLPLCVINRIRGAHKGVTIVWICHI